MKTFGVTLPFTGTLYVEVEATSEEEAIDVALQTEVSSENFESWNVCRQIVEGNVFYGEQNEAEAIEI